MLPLVSRIYSLVCRLPFVLTLCDAPHDAVTNGWCASTCALFTTVMNEVCVFLISSL